MFEPLGDSRSFRSIELCGVAMQVGMCCGVEVSVVELSCV